MLRNILWCKREQKGQSTVEFAILLPFLILLLLGIIQFGIIFSSYITVTSAAREGARIAIVGASDSEIKNKVIDSAAATPFLEQLTPADITVTPSTRVQRQPVIVSVNASVKILVPFLDYLVGSSFPVTSRAQMLVEYVSG